MYYHNEKDSYMFYIGSPTNVIDFLESQFIAAGWTINKKATTEMFDQGYGSVYNVLNITKTPILGNNTTDTALYGYRRNTDQGYTSTDGLWLAPRMFNANYDYFLQYNLTYDNGGNNHSYFYLNNYSVYPYTSVKVSETVLSAYEETYFNVSYNTIGYTLGNQYTYYDSADYVTAALSVTAKCGTNKFSYGHKSSELYVSSVTTYGNTIYYSFKYDYIGAKLYIFRNSGFDTTKAVNRQPGVLCTSDSLIYDYFYLKTPDINHPHNSVYFNFIADSNHFYLGLSSDFLVSQKLDFQYFYGGMVDKLFNFNGGEVCYGNFSERELVQSASYTTGSLYYISYEGVWYGSGVTSSINSSQGYIDMITPSPFTTAGYNLLTGEIYLAPIIAGINTTFTDNTEYKPIGQVHNLFKHYGVLPNFIMNIQVGTKHYISFPLDINNKHALAIE